MKKQNFLSSFEANIVHFPKTVLGGALRGLPTVQPSDNTITGDNEDRIADEVTADPDVEESGYY